RAGLAVAVRVAPALGLVLAIAPFPFPVRIDLVGGDVDDDAHLVDVAHGVEHVHGADHVRLVGPHGVDVRAPDERLGGHVDHDLGTPGGDHVSHPLGVADVALDRLHSVAGGGQLEQARAARLVSGAPDQLG